MNNSLLKRLEYLERRINARQRFKWYQSGLQQLVIFLKNRFDLPPGSVSDEKFRAITSNRFTWQRDGQLAPGQDIRQILLNFCIDNGIDFATKESVFFWAAWLIAYELGKFEQCNEWAEIV